MGEPQVGRLHPAQGDENAFCPAIALHGSAFLPFVIPSAAEGCAVSLSQDQVLMRSPARPVSGLARGSAGDQDGQLRKQNLQTLNLHLAGRRSLAEKPFGFPGQVGAPRQAEGAQYPG